MPNVFDGTNPITDILGDEPTEREVTMENQSTMTIIEPLTNTQIPAGQTVLVRVIGDMAHSTLVNNIQQINALQGFEVIGLTSVVIPDEPVAGGLLLVPTGADESADGEFQRFVWDGEHVIFGVQNGYLVDLAESDRTDTYTIQFKMPSIEDSINRISICVGDVASFTGEVDGNLLLLDAYYSGDDASALLNLYTQSVVDGDTPNYTPYLTIVPAPAAGTVITLEVAQSDVVLSFGSESNPVTLPEGFLPSLSGVSAYSGSQTNAVLPLSIKVAGA